ncbi:MAG: helix-turn-helix transcriptional regulator [Clostridiales bacterium]|nr:helix-turn-helix transcriptional regulator [Clostridiales bacterium]
MVDAIGTVILDDENADLIAKKLGDIFREVRTKKKLSQHKLSDHVEINTSYYSLIENGEVNLTLRKYLCICVGLEISPEIIMRGLIDSLVSATQSEHGQ